MNKRSQVVLITFLFMASVLSMVAGAPPPCIKATISNNGDFLVISNVELKSNRVERVTLEVFPKEEFINAKDRITSANTHWSNGPQWSVVLDSSNTAPFVPGCPMFLISDDGEYLIVLNQHVFMDNTALRIFRRRDHLGDPMRDGPDHGVFIRDVALREIWASCTFADPQILTDETPQWFAGGTFRFSTDSRVLIHTTRSGNMVLINLPDGSVKSTSLLPLQGCTWPF
jgi:hypothetical protein